MSRKLGESYERVKRWFFRRRLLERQMVRALGMKPLEHLRPHISSAVTEALEAIYVRNRYPTNEELEKMSQEFGESHERLYNWFFFQRTKEKNVIKATGMEGKLVEFRAIYENRTDLKRHWTRLEAAFQQDLFPTVEQQKLLAAELMVPYRSIVGWFLRRRRKERTLREQTGLDTSEFKRIGVRPKQKAKYLKEFVTQTGNLDPSKSQLEELASKMEVPLAVVRPWFIRRQRQKYRESRSQLSRERDALLQERFVQNRYPQGMPCRRLLKRSAKAARGYKIGLREEKRRRRRHGTTRRTMNPDC
ncbi:hypothetical protein CPB85DRAFT_374722 [Mucidula mucida]|nr:hypothetical protein CPB85DRAFT_374722 [Mucidula mucida]